MNFRYLNRLQNYECEVRRLNNKGRQKVYKPNNRVYNRYTTKIKWYNQDKNGDFLKNQRLITTLFSLQQLSRGTVKKILRCFEQAMVPGFFR